MHQSRWGFHPCSYAEFQELRQLWRVILILRRQVATWRRWAIKLPHNRVRRESKRDAAGRAIGYGPPVPIPEPPLPSDRCRKVTRPSGRVEIELAGPSDPDLRRLQEAYRLARQPRATPEVVEALPVTLADVQAWRIGFGLV